MSGRAGGGGGNGVAATTSFPVSGIMPPAPPADPSSIPKNSTNPKIATHSSGNLLPISVPHVMLPSLFHKDVLLTSGVSGNSRSHPFPRMKASDSPSQIMGMDFFIPFPVPNFGNGIFSFPSHSQNLGLDFFIPFPFPNFGNGLFQFTNRRLAFQMLAWNIGGDIPNRLKDLFNL